MWLGLHDRRVAATFGAGFSSISTDHWRSLATDPTPAQGYVHEWLHQVEGFYRDLGLGEAELPGLHEAGSFGSTRPADEPPFGHTYAEYHDGVPATPERVPVPGLRGTRIG